MARLDLFGFVPFRLNRLAAEASRRLAAVYAERFGIEVAEWRVLATLGHKAPLTPQAIARSTGMHKSRVSRAVARLESLGHIERTENARDRRAFDLRMTATGDAFYTGLVPVMLEAERRLLADLDEAECAALDAVLTRLEKAFSLERDIKI